MGDSSISRIYQFLSKYNKTSDWKQDADRNDDGIIIKAEAYSFLNNNFEWQDGDDKNDIIYKFWKTIDTEITGKVKSGSKINNQNALSDSEMEKFERNIAISEQVDKFMKKIGIPSNKIKDIKGWRDTVKSSILEKAFEYITKNPNASGISNEQLQQFYELSMRPATVKYVADATIEEKLGKIKGYASGDDKTLDAIINEYMKTLDGDSSTSIDTLISKIEEIVSAYADTAVNNNQTDKLKEYGYDTEGPLNDLQKAVLENSITDTITKYLTANVGELVNSEEYKDTVNACIKNYIESYLNGKKASDFVSLKSFDINAFASSQDFANLIQAITDAETAKNAEKYKAAFSTISTGMQQEFDENWRDYTRNLPASIHTEFGVDANGNIVFEAEDTNKAYNQLKQKIIATVSLKYPEEFKNISGIIDKLLQSAWITAYNNPNYNSSQHNPTNAFMREVMTNFVNIMNKLSTNPEYLSIFAGHTAYADGSLTDSLNYYGQANTAGDDSIWIYEGNCTIDPLTGDVDWDNEQDAKEYGDEMDLLLKNIQKSSKYKGIDKTKITTIFRQAQQMALDICTGNLEDCPFGTTSEVTGNYHETGFARYGLPIIAAVGAAAASVVTFGGAAALATAGAISAIGLAGSTASGIAAVGIGATAAAAAGGAAGYGIGSGVGSLVGGDSNGYSYTSLVATGGEDWAGTSRGKDWREITVQALVELTLYCFDKLLYKELLS